MEALLFWELNPQGSEFQETKENLDFWIYNIMTAMEKSKKKLSRFEPNDRKIGGFSMKRIIVTHTRKLVSLI